MIRLPQVNPQDPPSGRAQAPQGGVVPTPNLGAAYQGPSEGDKSLSGLARDVQEARISDSRTRVQTALNSSRDTFREQFESPNGFLNTIGTDASEDRKTQAFKAVEDKTRTVRDGLKNNYERELFDQHFADMHRSFQVNADEHYVKQSQVRAAGAAQADLTNAIDNAVRAHGTPEFLDQARHAVTSAMWLAHTMRWDPTDPRRKQLIDSTTSKIHTSVIEKLLTAKDGTAAQQAQDYLNGVPDEQLDPDVKTKLLDLIDRQGLQDTARTHSKALIDQAGLDVANQLLQPQEPPAGEQGPQEPQGYVQQFHARERQWEQTMELAMQRADAIPDAAVREATLKILQARRAEHDAQMARAGQRVREDAERWIQQQPTGASLDWSTSDAPVELKQNVDAFGLTAEITNLARDRVKVSDPQAQIDIRTMSPQDWVDAARRRDEWIKQYAGALTPEDLKVALGLMDKNLNFSLGYDQSESLIHEQALQAAMAADFNPKSKSLDDQRQIQWFVNRYRQMIREEDLKPGTDRVATDVLQRRLRLDFAYMQMQEKDPRFESPEARAMQVTTPSGYEVGLRFLAHDAGSAMNEQITKKAKALGLDPGEFTDRAAAFEAVQQDQRAASVAETRSWLQQANIAPLRDHTGYAPIDLVAARLGLKPETLVDEVEQLHGIDSPVLYHPRGRGGRFDLPQPGNGAPFAISIEAVDNLRKIPSLRDR